MAGIYLHIPFCKQACHYCNFHFSTQTKHIDAFVDALLKEIEQRRSYIEKEKVSTIYFGGGTPSLLSEKHLGRIIDRLYKTFEVDSDAEITLESNPDDLSKDKLESLNRVGVNRLSIGVQSFIERDLTQMNRAHSVQEADTSVKQAQDLGFENITIDLMYGLPQLSNTEWKENVQKAIDLQVPHISSYCLTLEEKTALSHFVSKGKVDMVNDSVTEHQFTTLIEMLQNNSFEHYEISNFAKEGYISKHNSAYWLGEKYLGLGPSAHSFDGNDRGWNVANNQKYISSVNTNDSYFEVEKLTPENKFNEYIMTRLRTKWGVNKVEVKQRFPQFQRHLEDELQKLNSKNWILESDTTYNLSAEGKLFADQAAMDLFV